MDCIICLNSIEDFYVPEFMKCEHYCFHKHCLKKWLEKGNSCPICRKEYDREPTIIQEKIKQEFNKKDNKNKDIYVEYIYLCPEERNRFAKLDNTVYVNNYNYDWEKITQGMANLRYSN